MLKPREYTKNSTSSRKGLSNGAMAHEDEMARILLVNAPFFSLYGPSKVAVSHYFPLGIGYIASYVNKHGYDVELLVESGDVDVFRALRRALKTHKYLFVGISTMTTAFGEAVRLARVVRESAPGTPVVAGGPHITAMGGSILAEQPEFDILCVGEGEITSLELARAIDSGRKDFGDIEGVIWRGKDGKIIASPRRPLHTDLDDFPHPARDLVDFSQFSIHSHVRGGKGRGAALFTSRGCPFGCIFCSAHLTCGKKVRYHSEDYVLEELKLLRDRFAVEYAWFQDDTLTVNRKRTRRLCDRIRQENLGMTFGCFSRVDVFDDEMARILSGAGVRMVTFGIESGVPEILEKIGKQTDLQQAKSAVECCRKYGIRAIASFVVGFPFETREDIRKTIEFGKGLDASILMFNPLVPFPGTVLFHDEIHKPSSVDGWTRFLTTNKPPFDMCPEVPARELKAMVERAHLLYYLRPRRIWHALREMSSVTEVWQSGRAFLGLACRAVSQR